MKRFMSDTLNELFNGNILDDQEKCEYLKYNMRKCTISFSKKLAKSTNKKLLTQKQNSSISKDIMKIVPTTYVVKSVSKTSCNMQRYKN